MRLTCCLADQIRPCDGPIQLHHCVPQQAIRRRYRSLKAAHRRGGPKPWSITAALKDPANLTPVCWSHHQLVEGHRIQPDPPPGFSAFLDRYDLYAVLPRHLSRTEAA